MNQVIDGRKYEVYRIFEQAEDVAAYFQWFDVGRPESQGRSTINDKEIELDVLPGPDHSGVGGLTRIPFVMWGDGPKESLAADVWFLSKAWMNLNSVLSNIIHNQAFQRSIFSGIDKEEVAKMTEWTLTVVSSDKAQIFTIPPGDPAAAQVECDKLKREIHRRAKFEFNQLADDTRDVQSAQSKAMDTIVQKVIYDTLLDEQTKVERKIYQLHAEYEGADSSAIQVSIDRDYGLADPEAEEVELLTLFNEAREMGVSEVQKQVLRIRAVRPKYVPTADETEEEIRQKVMDAIENTQTPAAQASATINSLGATLFGTKTGVTKANVA